MDLATLFIGLYWGWVGSEVLLQLVTRTSRSRGKIKDRGSLWLLLAVIFVSIWAALSYPGSRGPMRIAGGHRLTITAMALFLAGLVIRWTAVLTLGRSFSTNVAIHPDQALQKTGPYRWVRHPSYTGMLLIFAAIGLSQRNWLSLGIMLVFPTAALLYRIHVEEMALTEAFGEDYREYSKETKRLVPGIY